jgi:hypothetical protein
MSSNTLQIFALFLGKRKPPLERRKPGGKEDRL